MAAERLFVLSQGLAGREADYVDWYRQFHLADLLAIDCVRAGQLCLAEAGGSWTGPQVLAIYDLAAGSGGLVFEEIASRRGTPRFSSTNTLDPASVMFMMAWALPGSAPPPDVESGATHRLVIFSQLASAGGVENAQDYALAPRPGSGALPWRFLRLLAASPQALAEVQVPGGGTMALFRVAEHRSKD
jgi:hypothetical protein